MSHAIHRQRVRSAERRGEEPPEEPDHVTDERLDGDAEQTEMATSAVSELVKSFGKMGAGIQKSKEDAEKAKKAEAAAALARDARSKATTAQNKAQLDAMRAQAEANPGGPLHQAALVSAQAAANADEEARRLELAAGITSPLPASMTSAAAKKAGEPWYSRVPWWGWLFGAGALGGAGYLVFRHKGGSR